MADKATTKATKAAPEPPAKLAAALFAREFFPHIVFDANGNLAFLEGAEKWAQLTDDYKGHHMAYLSYLNLQQSYALGLRLERILDRVDTALDLIEALPKDIRDALLAAVASSPEPEASPPPARDPADHDGEADSGQDAGVEQSDAPSDVDERTDDEETQP